MYNIDKIPSKNIRKEKIKEYERFDLYQVYRVEGEKSIAIYKECVNR